MKFIKTLSSILIIMLFAALAITSSAASFYDTGTITGYDCRATVNTTLMDLNGQGHGITRADLQSGFSPFALELSVLYSVIYTDDTHEANKTASDINYDYDSYALVKTEQLYYSAIKSVKKMYTGNAISQYGWSQNAWHGAASAQKGIDF